jgi:uncharacterized membrane protein
MFGRNGSATSAVADAAGSLSPYADQLATDEKLRERLVAAVGAALAARQRARRQAGLIGLARRLGSDPVLREQLAEVVVQLQAAQRRVKKNRSHKTRNAFVFVSGVGVALAAVPSVRQGVMSKFRSATSGSASQGPHAAPRNGANSATTIEHEIEIDVPLSTAYNQWTQFEEFPKFMEGIQEVTQLDDTLLHWAASVAGKRAEWDAKIVAQEPDRRIVWESVDGKNTRGAVTFAEAGPGRTRIRLKMSYTPEGVAEKVGSAAGLDDRRVRGDLERFRKLIETEQVASGGWRGKIEDGQETSSTQTAKS